MLLRTMMGGLVRYRGLLRSVLLYVLGWWTERSEGLPRGMTRDQPGESVIHSLRCSRMPDKGD